MEERERGGDLGAIGLAVEGGGHGVADGGAELRGEREAGAVPARDDAAGRAAADFYVSAHALDADELERLAAEDEEIAGGEAADEVFFDGAERGAVEFFDGERGLGGDGADVHAVHAGDTRVGGLIEAVVIAAEAGELGIGGESGAAAEAEVEAPAPFVGGEVAIGVC